MFYRTILFFHPIPESPNSKGKIKAKAPAPVLGSSVATPPTSGIGRPGVVVESPSTLGVGPGRLDKPVAPPPPPPLVDE
jgi:hypothetical protein